MSKNQFNSLFIATVRPFNGSTESPAQPDKNGEMPVILNVVAGKAPNTRVLSGTVAKSAGFIAGKSYLVNSTEGEPDAEYGRRFTFDATKELDAMEIINVADKIGPAVIVDVMQPVATAPQTQP